MTLLLFRFTYKQPSFFFSGSLLTCKFTCQHYRSGHIPVLTAFGESPTGQVLCVDSNDAAIRIAQILKPMKVMFLNSTGGLVDIQGNVSEMADSQRF